MKLLLLSILLTSSWAYEVVDTSGDQLIVPGDAVSLHCSADADFFVCAWHHIDSGRKCTLLSGAPAEQNICADRDERISWNTDDPSTCHMVIDPSDGDLDAGRYRCTLFFLNDSEDNPESAVAEMDVTMAVAAHAELTGILAPPEDVPEEEGGEGEEGEEEATEDEEALPPAQLLAGEPIQVNCETDAAFPRPFLTVVVGDDEMDFESESVQFLESSVEDEDQLDVVVENDDGTFTVTATRTFIPEPADCGRFISCKAVQYPLGEETTGHALLATATTRQINVRYPPQPLPGPLGPYGFHVGDPSVTVEVHFMANPVPEDAEVVWQINPFGVDSDDSLVLSAGESSPDGRFEAPSLNITGHDVTAAITVYDLVEEDADATYVLKVSNEEGENAYEFRLVSSTYETPDEVGDNARVEYYEEEGDVQQGGVSVGTIVAIVLVVLAVAAVALFVFWAKSRRRFCFAVPVEQQKVAADAEQGTVATETVATDQDKEETAPLKGSHLDDEMPEADKGVPRRAQTELDRVN